ncbi:MAG TPA: dethiobiotin synthase [Roseimicrobium sp.]|nr:dethiobiotin synthase [Roseimicrobium sp.]
MRVPDAARSIAIRNKTIGMASDYHGTVMSSRAKLVRRLFFRAPPVKSCFNDIVSCKTWIITGTDTGVGKTVLTACLAHVLMKAGANVVALKPLCSGGREDVRLLCAATDRRLTLDEINPWHFIAPLAPPIAAKREGRRIDRKAVVRFIKEWQGQADVVLVEGAGGLLSPLGDDFTARDLMSDCKAAPIVVAPNRLGAVNQVLLVLEALPPRLRRQAQVILMEPAKPSLASRTNAGLLGGWMDRSNLHPFPWLQKGLKSTKWMDAAVTASALSRLLRMVKG